MIRTARAAFLGLAGVLTLLTVWVIPTPADASVGVWATPVKLSRSRQGNWFPKVAADDNGNVHVIYSGYHNTPTLLDIAGLWYTRSNGQTWSEPNDIALINEGAALRNSMAVDSAGRLFVSYKGWGTVEAPPDFNPPQFLGPEELWFMASSGSAGEMVQAWPPVRHRISRSNLAYYSDIAVDSRGVVHLIWTESDLAYRTEGFGWGLFYSSSADGGATWSPRIALDDNFLWWYRCHLTVDASDRLHVTYELTDPINLGRTRAGMYAQSADGGRTWVTKLMGGEVPRHNAPNETAGPQAPAVGVDGTGQIVFVYRELDTDQIFYRVSQDGNRWSAPQRLPGVRSGIYRPFDIYDMVTDSNGHVHLAFVGFPDNSSTVSLMHTEWDGHGWSPPDVVVATSYPEYPKLAIGGGNRLHLVWFTGDRQAIDRTALQIYYSTTTVSAPRVTSVALPVPQPTVAPLPTQLTRPIPQLPRAMQNSGPSIETNRQAAEGTRQLEAPPPSSLPLLVAMFGTAAMIGLVALVTLGRRSN